MSTPINPPSVTTEDPHELPAYLSNGLIGIRVLSRPLTPGIAIVSGLAGRHPVTQVEAAARAPYPLAGDIELNGAWMSEVPGQVQWPQRPVTLPSGWDAIEVDRLWVRDEEFSLRARHGATRSTLDRIP